ncbi:hypothetical protein V8E51_004210 [Hyaloscypha variabilis]
MLFSLNSLIVAASLVATVASHGLITKPVPRGPGTASLAACGKAVTNNIKGDLTSHVEGLPEAAKTDSTYKPDECNLWLCRGLQYGDNTANVEAYTAGQVVPFDVKITIKHNGTANVSIVDTKSNKVVKQLLYWDHYADEKLASLPANNTAFDVTIPSDLNGACATAGSCVLQWWWYGYGAKQTYESCVDFTVAAPTTAKMMNKRFWRV